MQVPRPHPQKFWILRLQVWGSGPISRLCWWRKDPSSVQSLGAASQSVCHMREPRVAPQERLGSSRKPGRLCLPHCLQRKAAEHPAGQRFSKSGPQTSPISITLALVRKANLWTPRQSYWITDSGSGTQQSVLTNPPGHSDAHWYLRTLQQRIIRWPFVLPFGKVPLASGYGCP